MSKSSRTRSPVRKKRTRSFYFHLRVLSGEVGAEEEAVLGGVPHSLVPREDLLLLLRAATAYLLRSRREEKRREENRREQNR